MVKNANFVSHKKSKQIIDGKPKLPLASDIVEGEIAVNFGKDVETLSIKNESGDVVTFSSDNYYTEQKLGSGFTGENSANTVTSVVGSGFTSSSITDVIIENEEIVSNALTDLDERIDTLSGTVSAHTENTEIHVTAADKTTWNAKVDVSAIANFFDDAKYEDSGTTKVINFYHGNTIKATINASDFIVDGMVDDVRIDNGYLVIDFNTASGKQDISIPLTDIFDPSNYYNKTEIDDLVGSGFTSSSITEVIIENEEIVSAALTDLDERKLDASAYTPTDLSNYYTKSETSGATELSTAFGAKVDSSTFTAHTASTVHMNNTEKTNLDSLATNIAAISGITSTKVGNWDTAYTNNHTHSNKTALDSITGNVGTMAYQDASSYSSATQVNTALEGKVSITDIVTAITTSNSGSTNPIATKVIAENERVTASALTDLDERKLDASAYTPSDLSNYYTKSETSGATELTTAFGGKLDATAYTPTDLTNYYTKSETSGATELATAFDSKLDSSIYSVFSAATNESITQINSSIIDLSGQSETVSVALNYLNENKADVSAVTPVDLSNYYTKSETSGATEISNALSGKVNSATFTGHTADTTMHFTTTEKSNLDSLTTNIAAISGITSTKVGNWDTAYTNNHTHGNKTALDSITGSVGTMAYQNASSYSSATQVNTALAGKTDTGTTTALNNVVTGHTGNTNIHVTTSDKATWNTVTAKTDNSAFTAHTANTTAHITAAERTSWNNAVSGVTDLSGQSETIAAALNVLNERITQLEEQLSSLTNN